MREELGRERKRREQAERERDGLRRKLEALQGASGGPQSAPEASGGTDPEKPTGAQEAAREHSTIVERPAEEPARRPWWIRWFGG